MSTNLILIAILLTLCVHSKILQEEISNDKLLIQLSMDNEEEIIDFQNIVDQSYDQVKCNKTDCQCLFSSENSESGQIAIIQCEENTISFFRTNINFRTISKENRYRIATETYTDSDMPNSLTVSSGLTLKWKFNSDGTIEFATIWNKLSWLGIGFGSSMRNVDMITINVSGSTVNLIDLYSTSDNTPSTDSSQDYTLISYSVGSSSVSTRFSRKLSTGDSKDKTLTQGSTYSWSYAYSSAKSMEMHSYYSGFSITLSDSAPASTSSSTGSTTSSSSSTDTSSASTGTSSTSTDTSSASTGTSSTSTDTSSTSTGTSSTSTDTSTSTSTSNTSGSTTSTGSTKTSQGLIISRILLLITIGIILVAF